jgi:hypothetical protein
MSSSSKAVWNSASFTGTLRDWQHEPGGPPNHGSVTVYDKTTSGQTWSFVATDGTNATMALQYCPDGVPVTFNADATLTYPAFHCPIYTGQYPAGCQYNNNVVVGSGTWDYSGNLSVSLRTDFSSCLGDVYDDYTFTGTKQ